MNKQLIVALIVGLVLGLVIGFPLSRETQPTKTVVKIHVKKLPGSVLTNGVKTAVAAKAFGTPASGPTAQTIQGVKFSCYEWVGAANSTGSKPQWFDYICVNKTQ
jgi:hypothetical protein